MQNLLNSYLAGLDEDPFMTKPVPLAQSTLLKRQHETITYSSCTLMTKFFVTIGKGVLQRMPRIFGCI